MRPAVILLSLVAVIAAEAPYHLPRPGVGAPVLQYQRPAPPKPPALPQLPAPHPPQFHPQPQPIAQPQAGYNYQPPAPAPVPFIPSQPQVVYSPAPAPQPLPVYQPQPAPQPITYVHPQPISQPQPLPQPSYISPKPAPQPPPINYYQPQPFPSQPSSIYQHQVQASLPQPIPVSYPQPIQVSQPAPLPISQPAQPPSTSYGTPQLNLQPALPQQSFEPIRPLPALLPQPLPQAPIQQITVSNYHQEQQLSSGYSYPQPFAQSVAPQAASPQVVLPAQNVQLPLQQTANAATSLSSYQADTNQYNAQSPHHDALDNVVVNHLQNIITENEHSSAREAGYLSLVSGISLENARPSVEISSFVQTSPLNVNAQSSGTSVSQSSAATSSAASAPSVDYGLPTASGSQSSSSSSSSSGFEFLPQDKPALSYGVPK